MDFMSLQSDSETFFCRFLVVSEWSPSDSTVGHATPCFFSATLADLGKNNRLHLIDRMPVYKKERKFITFLVLVAITMGAISVAAVFHSASAWGIFFCGAKYLCLTPTHGQASLNKKLDYSYF